LDEADAFAAATMGKRMENQDGLPPNDPVRPPGKTRTWWHPLLVGLFNHVMATAYAVVGEVEVGKMPLRVDILLIRREGGGLSAAARRSLGVLVALLNRFTLLEFKGPTDTLEFGDLAQLLGCAFLWHSQQTERIPLADVSLIVLAPQFNAACREEQATLGYEADEHAPGVWRLSGLPFTAWLVETDIMAARGEPILSLVSHSFLKEPSRIMETLGQAGESSLLYYMLQQVQQFRHFGKDFAMAHTETAYLGEVEEELKRAVLQAMPVRDRIRGLPPEEVVPLFRPEDRLRGLNAEERLCGLNAEDRLRGLNAEERLRGLSRDERARLRRLLDEQQDE
jgi:hypothetical protein